MNLYTGNQFIHLKFIHLMFEEYLNRIFVGQLTVISRKALLVKF